ncbi:hypothetical protein [Arthrobacter alpinus]|uniref:hypothetical protein n=1 Tax=Arthrobacter alpinus TaxID=656366 RepID=UPI0012FF450D|nr:hypothetical protein [Arthrobacter alpinus]
MSTPNEQPGPSQPVPPGYGSTPIPPNQPGAPTPPPPGYQTPPGYQQPGYQQQPPPQQTGDFKFEMPKDMPKSMNDVMPVGGFAGLFKMNGLPQMLKVSYILWLVTAGLGLLVGVISFLGSLVFLGSGFGSVRGLIATLISLALMVAVVICAMKLKEGMQWARLALSASVIVSFILLFLGGGGVGLLGVVAAVFMWLPESTAWLNSRSRTPGY